MKTNFTLLAALILFVSCSTLNKIIVIDDPFKEEKSIKLLQDLDGYSDEHKSRIYDKDYYFLTKTVFTKSERRDGKVILELKLTTTARPEDLDSTIYIQIDDTKYKLVSNNYALRNYINSSTSTTTETSTSVENDDEGDDSSEKEEGKPTTTTSTITTTTDRTLQAMKHTFEIPEFLWPQIADCNKLMFRAYIENEGIDVKFKKREEKQFKQFFKEVIDQESN